MKATFKNPIKWMFAAGVLVAASASFAQVTLYQDNNFQGSAFTTQQAVGDFQRFGFNDRASSVVVASERWEVCDGQRFSGRCVVLRPGRYPSLAAMGLNDRVSSVRAINNNARVDDDRYAPLPGTGQGNAQVVFYENENYQGRSFTAQSQIDDFTRYGYNDRASSVVVLGDRWEVCNDVRFGGRCVVLRPGRYPSLAAMGLNDRVSSVRAINNNARVDDDRYAPLPGTGQGNSQVVFYENENYQGQSFTAQTQIDDFTRYGFNDRASSVVVLGDRWEACNDVRFGGRCVVLRPGRYPSLAAMGLNDRVSSVRDVGYDTRISDERYAPAPPMVYDNRKRNDEQLYTVNVSSVRAVMGPAEQRCWTESAPVAPAAPVRAGPNVGAAIVGGLLGGVLGHQVGGGTGKTVATVGGALAGAALGGYVIGRVEPGQAVAQNVQRCDTVSGQPGQPGQVQPSYYDVTYYFRGQEHHAQMTSAPGSSITVNGQGEPRV